jgi:hypothetical protein
MSGDRLDINDPKVQNAEKQLLILEEWPGAPFIASFLR